MCNPIEGTCQSCKAGPYQPCRWKRPPPDGVEFHAGRVAWAMRCQPKQERQLSADEPPESEEWLRGKHRAYHKLRIAHDCAEFPAPLTREVTKSL